MTLPTNYRTLTHDGTTLHIAAWARKTGVPAKTIHWRVRQGLPSAECLCLATRNPIVVQHNGRMQRLSVWADEIGITLRALRRRWQKGERPPHLFRPTRNQRGMPGYVPKDAA